MSRLRFQFVSYQFLFYIIFQMLLRMAFLCMSLRIVSLQPGAVLRTFALGLVYDVITGLCYSVPLIVVLLILPVRWLNTRKGQGIIWVCLFCIDAIVFLIAWNQILFWNEFQSTFNYLTVDYLFYMLEAFNGDALFQNFIFSSSVLVVVSGITTFLQMHHFSKNFVELPQHRKILAVLMAFVMPALLLGVVSDSWRFYASTNHYNVEIAANGTYSLICALKNQKLEYESNYPLQNEKLIEKKLRQRIAVSNATFNHDKGICRQVVNNNKLTGKRPNIVILIIGSINYGPFGMDGSWQPIAPHLNDLMKSSYVYSNMYSVGPRMTKALEAITYSLPPSPGNSNPTDNKHLISLVGILEENGYHSDIHYGGYGHFIKIDDFFNAREHMPMANLPVQAQNILDKEWWSVPDETLYTQALDRLDEHYDKGELAAELILTMSNQYPYTFPEGRVDARSGKPEGAAVYSDWAMDDFLKRAAQKPWFDNTVFVIIADHEARMTGHKDLSTYRYRIPCLIYAPKLIEKGENTRLMSQVDIAPTLFGKLGISYKSHFLGRDIDQVTPGDECAFISTDQHLGYIKGDYLIVLSPGKRVKTYRIGSWNRNDLEKVDNNPELTEEAIMWYQGTSYLLKSSFMDEDS